MADEEDIDFNFDELDGEPDYRVTIRGDRLMLTYCFPWLARGGPLGKLARDRGKDGVYIADLTIADDDLLVRVHASPADASGAEGRLLEWAATVGYTRVWLPSGIVDLDGVGTVAEAAAVTCDSCGIEWDDPTPELWEQVHSEHSFPRCCPVCGTDLPQWQTRPDKSRPVSHSPRARRSAPRPSTDATQRRRP